MRIQGTIEIGGAIIRFDEEVDLDEDAFLATIGDYGDQGVSPDRAASMYIMDYAPPVVRVTSFKV